MTTLFTLKTDRSEQTRTIGKIIGQSLQSGTRIALVGDLGSGKTVFVQGLARGLDVPSDYYITSPTYTLINEYPGRLRLYHVDLYRLTTGNDVETIGLDDILSTNAVVAIEWADRLQKQNLDAHIAVEIQIVGEGNRKITLTGYGRSQKILLKEIEKKCGEYSWD